MSNIGEYIKNLRESKGYSQRKLGYLSKISHATINRIENNITLPTPNTLRKLALGLGVPYEEMLKVAGYLESQFSASSLKAIREEKQMDYQALSKDIQRATGYEINPSILESIENGDSKHIRPEHMYTLSKYQSLSYKESGSGHSSYSVKDSANGNELLKFVQDVELKNWMTDPQNLDYLAMAKKIADLGVNPDFILQELVSKMFKEK